MCYKIAFAIVLSAAAISFSQESADDSSLARRQPENRKTVEQIVRESRNSIVVVTTEGREGDQSGMGTGFVIDDVGLIATNLHVIGEARPVSVQFPNGERFSVKEIFASDRTLDLAILRIDFKDKLRSLSLADETAIAEFSEGKPAVVIGHPLGLKNTVVNGIVAAEREINGAPMWQVAMTIEPGNSGGPLFDMMGRVQGVVSMKSTGTEAFGFAVKIAELKKLIERPNPIAIKQWQTIGRLDPNRWQAKMGARWRQRKGRLIVSGPGRGFGGRSLLLRTDDAPKVPYELAVSVKLDDESGAAGLVFHSDRGDRHYGFYPSGGQIRLTSFEGPSVFAWNVLREIKTENYKPNEWNEIKVRVEEKRIVGFVNGREVLTVDGVRQVPGAIGLCKFRQTKAQFRDFRFGPSVASKSLAEEQRKEIADKLLALPTRGDLRDTDLEAYATGAANHMSVLEAKARDLEQRAMELRELGQTIHIASTCGRLSELLAGKADAEIDLFSAALLIAKLDNAEIDVQTYVDVVDSMAKSIRSQFKDEMTESDRLAVMDEFLFRQNGFHGSRTEYYNAANSHMDRVIDDREGLPVTLSVLYIELARRLDLKVVGVGLPGHFVVRHEPARGESQLIDVFDRGKRLSRNQAEVLVTAYARRRPMEEDFASATPKSILVRMLTNLHQLAQSKNDTAGMLRYTEAIVAIMPDDPQWRGMRGVLRHQEGLKQAALDDLDRVIEQQPPGIDLDQIRRMRQALER